ncbi:MAG: alkaline shock response membrane anchor protein AmaP [Clostridia bacterium]|nr:alkaline shock response membrane anchor protein AmaP [Clostridia bacterium]
MKIKFRDRLILFLGAVLTALSGVVLFVAGLQIQGIIAEMALWARVVCILFGLLLIAFGGYLLFLPRTVNAAKKDFVVQKTENGELRIAVKAIENLVQKCIDLHEEITVRSMKILNSREGVIVDLFVSLANNISIPMAIASLQKQIKQYLVASSGIEVKEVRVSVESTQDEPAIEQIAEEEEKEEEAALPQAEEKPPLHQRLFGRQNQPAIMPQAPDADTEKEDEGDQAPTEEEEARDEAHEEAEEEETEVPAHE